MWFQHSYYFKYISTIWWILQYVILWFIFFYLTSCVFAFRYIAVKDTFLFLPRLERAKKLQEQKEKEMFEKQQQQQQEIAAGKRPRLHWILKCRGLDSVIYLCWSLDLFSPCYPYHSCCCCCSRSCLKPWPECGSPPGLWDTGHTADCCGSSDGSPASKNTGRDWYCCSQLLQPILCKPHEVCWAGEKEEIAVAGKEGWGKFGCCYIVFCCFHNYRSTEFGTGQVKK